jgi:hypothetical protein
MGISGKCRLGLNSSAANAVLSVSVSRHCQSQSRQPNAQERSFGSKDIATSTSLAPKRWGVAKLEELFCLYAELFHARQQGSTINPYARGSSASATDSTFGFL